MEYFFRSWDALGALLEPIFMGFGGGFKFGRDLDPLRGPLGAHFGLILTPFGAPFAADFCQLGPHVALYAHMAHITH